MVNILVGEDLICRLRTTLNEDNWQFDFDSNNNSYLDNAFLEIANLQTLIYDKNFSFSRLKIKEFYSETQVPLYKTIGFEKILTEDERKLPVAKLEKVLAERKPEIRPKFQYAVPVEFKEIIYEENEDIIPSEQTRNPCLSVRTNFQATDNGLLEEISVYRKFLTRSDHINKNQNLVAFISSEKIFDANDSDIFLIQYIENNNAKSQINGYLTKRFNKIAFNINEKEKNFDFNSLDVAELLINAVQTKVYTIPEMLAKTLYPEFNLMIDATTANITFNGEKMSLFPAVIENKTVYALTLESESGIPTDQIPGLNYSITNHSNSHFLKDFTNIVSKTVKWS